MLALFSFRQNCSLSSHLFLLALCRHEICRSLSHALSCTPPSCASALLKEELHASSPKYTPYNRSESESRFSRVDAVATKGEVAVTWGNTTHDVRSYVEPCLLSSWWCPAEEPPPSPPPRRPHEDMAAQLQTDDSRQHAGIR